MATYATEQEFKNAIITSVTKEMATEPLFNVEVFADKVDDAINEFKLRRGYEYSSLTEAEQLQDMIGFYAIIKNVAVIYYNRIGDEGESYHYENTVHRSMHKAEELFSAVFSFVKVF